LHSPFEKSIIERAIEYVKDRTETFDDYYPCVKEDCNFKHVYNWIGLFVFMYNAMRVSIKATTLNLTAPLGCQIRYIIIYIFILNYAFAFSIQNKHL
jgi:hypothetical protein